MSNLTTSHVRSLLGTSNLSARFEKMHAVNFKRENVKQILSESDKKGKPDLALTSQAILLRSVRGDYEEAFELTKWSLTSKEESRKSVVKTFISNKQSSFLIHQTSRLKRAEAKTIMVDYFEQGGDLNDVAEWLSVAGSILKTGTVPTDTDVWGWVKDAVGSAVGAVVGAINTVADAIKAAGKSLADAIGSVVNWTQKKINDFVEAILAAGQKVIDILSEAAKKGISVVNKFIDALLAAGQQGLSILNWAFNKAANLLNSVLQRLERIYGSFTTLLIEIAKMATSRLSSVVQALLNIGKKVIDFVLRLDRIAYDVAKQIVQLIRNAGKSIKELMSALINRSRYIARIVLDALISLNAVIANLFREVITWSVTQLKTLIGALKDLGISLNRILDEIAKFVKAEAIKLMQALRMIWSKLVDILQFIAGKSASVIHTLLVALLGTGVHVLKVLKAILVDLRTAFRESLIKGLIQIGQSALTLMKEAVKISLSVAAVLFAIIMDITGTHRGLNPSERAEAEKVFGVSIDLDRVKLTNASLSMDFIMWITQLANREPKAFVTMYVINFKPGDSLTMSTLIHELTHIWQAVNSGGVYMIEALHSQFFGQGYKLTDNDVTNANGDILNLEREQQAVLVEEYWRAEFDGKSIPLSLDLIRPLAKQVYKSSLRFNPIRLIDLDITRRVVAPISPARP